MKITLTGYGKMGREVEKILLQRGHSAGRIITRPEELKSAKPDKSCCIDFSTPDAFRKNYKLIADKFVGAIVGTTGWYDILPQVKKYFTAKKKKLIYGTNFSVGVNILFEVTGYASELLGKFDYNPYIIELHHKEKKDAPSGTAVTLKNIIGENFETDIPVSSLRRGFIKGIHDIGFESEIDKINIRHEAYSRQGFAMGAVLAAEWINNVKGTIEFKELFKQKIKNLK
ncbi:MAG: 4-hydroxy-tetrahydrodipicolinate reductase [Ignavibacteriae bacterium]|nr:4-hydroxy-tetrahydrodipicolinate reductase [Ignavibacteriota bacterium]